MLKFIFLSRERAFLKSLEDYSCEKGRDGMINSSTFGSSFREWKYCRYELDQLMGKDFLECPSCNPSQHSAHVDGNMKLYRFKSAGMQLNEPYYKEIFIASKTNVDQHIQEVYKKSNDMSCYYDNTCGASTWRAAANSLKRKKGLDETGLEIVACRHAIAQHAVNMYSGELYGYAHYLQTVSMHPKKVLFFWYDVICKYWPWLVNRDPDTSQTMKPALSVMHAKAHSWSCQVLWGGGRMQEGACGTTGEEVELVNSHFSRLGTTTKHMLPERREELLTEHALSWNKRKIVDLPISLPKRYAKAKIQLNKARQEMVHLSGDLPISNINAKMFNWTKDVKDIAKEQELCHKPAPLSSHEKFFLGASLAKENLSVEAPWLGTAAA